MHYVKDLACFTSGAVVADRSEEARAVLQDIKDKIDSSPYLWDEDIKDPNTALVWAMRTVLFDLASENEEVFYELCGSVVTRTVRMQVGSKSVFIHVLDCPAGGWIQYNAVRWPLEEVPWEEISVEPRKGAK